MSYKNQKKNKSHVKDLHTHPGNSFFSHKLQNWANKLRKAAAKQDQAFKPLKND